MCFAFLNVAEKRALLWKQQQQQQKIIIKKADKK